MAKPISATRGPRKHPAKVGKIVDVDTKIIRETRIYEGMISSIDSADIPTSALQLAQNCRSRFDRMERRSGTARFSPTAADVNPVLSIYYFKEYDGTEHTIRFTPSSIFELGVGVWVAFAAGAGGVLSGGATDRFRVITAFNRVFFANGVDPVQEIDVAANTYKGYGNAPTWKYITAFADRVFGANLVASTVGVDAPPNPVYIGWSGAQGTTGGIDEWDPAVEETSGRQPLLESPGDLSDEITGMFAFTNYLVVLRERSVWLGTKQAIPTLPVRFFAAWPGFGCDCPNSAQVCEQSLIWLDTRTRTVWQYPPNGTPTRIGANIEEQILEGLSDPSQVFSGYDPIENEYYVGYKLQSNNFSRIWVYNMRTQSWTYDEIWLASCMTSVPLASGGGTTIDALAGTIDELTGTINGLSGFSSSFQALEFGRSDGDIVLADATIGTDFLDAAGATVTFGFQTLMDSKDFEQDVRDGAIVCVRIEVQATIGGSFAVLYRKNNDEWQLYRYTFFVASDMKKPRIFNFKKNLRARRFAFRIFSDEASFRLLSYEVHVTHAGMSRHNLGNTTT